MKFILQSAIVFGVGYALALYLPFWSLCIPALFVGFFFKSKHNFMAGFLGAGSLWLFKSLMMDAQASASLVGPISEIFSVPPFALFLLVAFVAGLIGGLACTTSALLRRRKNKPHYYS